MGSALPTAGRRVSAPTSSETDLAGTSAGEPPVLLQPFKRRWFWRAALKSRVRFCLLLLQSTMWTSSRTSAVQRTARGCTYATRKNRSLLTFAIRLLHLPWFSPWAEEAKDSERTELGDCEKQTSDTGEKSSLCVRAR